MDFEFNATLSQDTLGPCPKGTWAF